MTYLSEDRTCLKYDIPLGEVVTDFFDELKSRSKGYASMSTRSTSTAKTISETGRHGRRTRGAARSICHRDKSRHVPLKELIPRQMFRIPIQAAIGTKVIASTSISAMRKDVLPSATEATSRGKETAEKQAAGKKRMKQFKGGGAAGGVHGRPAGGPEQVRGRAVGSGFGGGGSEAGARRERGARRSERGELAF